MDKDTLQKLLDGKPLEIKSKGAVLFNSVGRCIEEYQNEPTTVKLRNWQSAEEALSEFIEQIDGPKADNKGATLPNILAVVDHLAKQGWKIKKSAAYNAAKDGRLHRQNDGTFLISDIARFAVNFLRRLDGQDDKALDRLQKERLIAEVDKTKAQARHWTIKAEAYAGAYVPRDLFERELARRVAIFRNDLETFAASEAGGIVSLASGNPDRIPEVIEHLLSRFEDFLARYAEEQEFTVPLPPPDKDSDDEMIEEE